MNGERCDHAFFHGDLCRIIVRMENGEAAKHVAELDLGVPVLVGLGREKIQTRVADTVCCDGADALPCCVSAFLQRRGFAGVLWPEYSRIGFGAAVIYSAVWFEAYRTQALFDYQSAVAFRVAGIECTLNSSCIKIWSHSALDRTLATDSSGRVCRAWLISV